MNASEVLAAIRRHHHTAAIVPEVCIQDDHDVWEESFEKSTGVWTRRIDALMFKSLERTAIEIKTSVADAKRDTWEKVTRGSGVFTVLSMRVLLGFWTCLRIPVVVCGGFSRMGMLR